MAAASGPLRIRPRLRSAIRCVALLAVNAAAIDVAWLFAEWRVPLPPRPAAGESVEAWTRAFNHYFHVFFAVYVAAGLALLYGAAVALRKCGAMPAEDFLIHNDDRCRRNRAVGNL